MGMIPKTMIKKVTKFTTKVGVKLKKHLPEILVAAGIVTSGTAIVSACVETTKLDPVLDKAKARVDDIHEKVAEAEDRELATTEAKKELTKVYVSTVVDLGKLYIPAVSMEVLSIACFLTGHKIMMRRNMELAAAYTACFNAFKAYRGRVVNKYGEDVDYDLYHNTTTREVVDSETGEVTKVREFNEEPENYEMIFGPDCPSWDCNPVFSKNVLSNAQNYLNDLLESKGIVLENDLREELYLKPTTRGAVNGWARKDINPNGDGYIELRATPVERKNPDGTVDTVFTLDPNYDGTVVYMYDKALRLEA